jgi:cardiolipin synthase A/B
MVWLVCQVLLMPEQANAAPLARRMRDASALKSASSAAEPRAFVRGNLIRIYYVWDGNTNVFRAELRQSPIQGLDYVYFLARLKLDATPPSLPSSRSNWREAKTITREQWSNLVETTAEQLTPAEPGRGAYFQFLSQERILYRDEARVIRAVRLEQKPANVEIMRSFSPRELGAELARRLSAAFEHEGGAEHVFLLTEQLEGKPPRFMLLDPGRKTCAFLFSLPTGDNAVGGSGLDMHLRFLTSLAVASHGLAVLKNPISSAARLVNAAYQITAGILHMRLPVARADLSAPEPHPGMDLTDWELWLDGRTGGHADLGSVKFLINGEEFFPAFAERLEAARQEAHVRICIFDNDDVAVEVADQLKQRSTNINVRVLVDLMSSQASQQAQPETPMREGFTPPRSIHRYLQAGSRVRVRSALNPWFTSDHTKVITIDRKYAFLGGMNIGREYRYEWHDLMVEVEGPIVGRLEHDFQMAWSHAGPLGDLAFLGAAMAPPKPALIENTNRNWALIRRLYTRTGNLQIRSAIFEAFRRARSHIYLENSYLYDPSVTAALIKARRRGLDVRVILPERCDNTGGNSSTYVTANYLLRNGIRVYLYPGMTHVKALLVDGWACFGSANFNRLSLRRNQEANLATSDPEITRRMQRELFEEDFARSHELTEAIEVFWTDYLAESILEQF